MWAMELCGGFVAGVVVCFGVCLTNRRQITGLGSDLGGEFCV